MRRRVVESFPGLARVDWQISSPETHEYNCVAFAAEEVTRWWWPVGSYYWPPASPRNVTLEAFTTAFIGEGYGLALGDALEPGLLKLAIFATDLGPSHVARQVGSGHWTSKLGSSVDIVHPLDALEGALYGSVRQILSRPLTS